MIRNKDGVKQVKAEVTTMAKPKKITRLQAYELEKKQEQAEFENIMLKIRQGKFLKPVKDEFANVPVPNDDNTDTTGAPEE